MLSEAGRSQETSRTSKTVLAAAILDLPHGQVQNNIAEHMMSKAGKPVWFTYGYNEGKGSTIWSTLYSQEGISYSFMLWLLLESTIHFFTVVTVLKICIAYEYVNYILKTEIQEIRNFPGVWPSQFYDP